MSAVSPRPGRRRPMAVRPHRLHPGHSPRLRGGLYAQPHAAHRLVDKLAVLLLSLACVAVIACVLLIARLATLAAGELLGALHLRGF